MGIRKYIKQKRKKKESLKEEEKRVIEMIAKELKNNSDDGSRDEEDEIPIEIKMLIEREGKPFSEKEWESLKQLIEGQKTDDEKINKAAIHDKLMDMELYRLITERVNKKRQVDLQLQFVSVLSLFFIILWSISSYTTGSANPFQFLIQVTEYIDGNMSVMTNVEEEEVEEVEFEVYQVGYMMEDYVLMEEKKYNKLHRMKYYHDKDHYIFIEQSPVDYKKHINLMDDMDYQTLLLDGVEYLYCYNSNKAISTLYFVKENNAVLIKGTIEKDEILHVAKELFKE